MLCGSGASAACAAEQGGPERCCDGGGAAECGRKSHKVLDAVQVGAPEIALE